MSTAQKALITTGSRLLDNLLKMLRANPCHDHAHLLVYGAKAVRAEQHEKDLPKIRPYLFAATPFGREALNVAAREVGMSDGHETQSTDLAIKNPYYDLEGITGIVGVHPDVLERIGLELQDSPKVGLDIDTLTSFGMAFAQRLLGKKWWRRFNKSKRAYKVNVFDREKTIANEAISDTLPPRVMTEAAEAVAASAARAATGLREETNILRQARNDITQRYTQLCDIVNPHRRVNETTQQCLERVLGHGGDALGQAFGALKASYQAVCDTLLPHVRPGEGDVETLQRLLGEYERISNELGKYAKPEELRFNTLMRILDSYQRDNDGVVIHECPRAGAAVTPCCGVPPFEKMADRITSDPTHVNCDRLRYKTTLEQFASLLKDVRTTTGQQPSEAAYSYATAVYVNDLHWLLERVRNLKIEPERLFETAQENCREMGLPDVGKWTDSSSVRAVYERCAAKLNEQLRKHFTRS